MPTEPKLPTSVVVGPFTHPVVVDEKRCKDADIAFARFNTIDGEILVNPDQGGMQLRDSVLHEVTHAICELLGCHAGGDAAIFDGRDHEERFVRGFSPALLDVLRRNPALVAFLLAD